MANVRIRNLASLRDEMIAVAKGEKKAPHDAAAPSFGSVASLARLLTPGNRRLLAIIRDKKPASVAELAAMSGRSQPNVTRTLNKLQAFGFVAVKTRGRCKSPYALLRNVVVEIDPYSAKDRLRFIRREAAAGLKNTA